MLVVWTGLFELQGQGQASYPSAKNSHIIPIGQDFSQSSVAPVSVDDLSSCNLLLLSPADVPM